MLLISPHDITTTLTYRNCIPVMRNAMILLSSGATEQMLRNILPLGAGNMFGIMGGTLGPGRPYGSKLISVMPVRSDMTLPSHQGVVVLFDPETNSPACQAEAGTITAIRTASASALATDLLARKSAKTLTIIGTGEQAHHHALAIQEVRDLERVIIWGRSSDRATTLARSLDASMSATVKAVQDIGEACSDADIVCTVTAAPEPVLFRDHIRPGTHINLVGSSFDGPREIDDELVAASRFFADSRASVLEQGAELRHAINSGLITTSHLLGEIGEIASGTRSGRTGEDEITVYNSLGHIVQDIAATAFILDVLKGKS